MEMKHPAVAPFESCIGCYRGDVRTGFAVRGVAEFHIASFHKLAGVPMAETAVVVQQFAEQEMGCDPGMVPGGPFTMIVRLCRKCAEANGANVADVDGDLPLYDEAKMFPEGLER